MEISIDSDPQNPSPIENIPNTVSVLAPKKNIFRPLFFLFFGLFLGTVIFSVYLLAKNNELTSTPQPAIVDETASWQTYTNLDYKFSIKYPSNYQVQIDNKNSHQLLITKINTLIEYNEGICSNCMVRIVFYPNDINGEDNIKTPEDLIKIQKGKHTETTLNGQTAYFFPDINVYMIFIKNGSNYDRYQIILEDNNDIFNKILSTFKFD